MKKYWLMKTEPNTFSIEDLITSPKKTTQWEGIRNYQARNFMRDEMKVGDEVLLYHSNCKNIGVVGVATVSKNAYPDYFSLDKKSQYFDPKSTKEKNLIVITLVHFAFWGPLIESLLIHKSNLLNYKHKELNNNIPLWLPTAYALFAITTLFTYDLFKNCLY